jgi:ribonucleotide reductase alpha subunit
VAARAPKPAQAAKRAAVRTAHPAADLSDNARVVLERRYLAKDARGKLIETPEQLFLRVAHNIAWPKRDTSRRRRPRRPWLASRRSSTS